MALGADVDSQSHFTADDLIPSCTSHAKLCHASRGFSLLAEITQPWERVGYAQGSGSNEHFLFNCFHS